MPANPTEGAPDIPAPGWSIVDPEGTIERECADKVFRQADAAMTYALAIIASNKGEKVDWLRMNAAIRNRWPKGLERVKEMAWKKCAEVGVRCA